MFKNNLIYESINKIIDNLLELINKKLFEIYLKYNKIIKKNKINQIKFKLVQKL